MNVNTVKGWCKTTNVGVDCCGIFSIVVDGYFLIEDRRDVYCMFYYFQMKKISILSLKTSAEAEKFFVHTYIKKMITHELQSTNFNIEDIDKQITGAGIIPICCTKDGFKVLLGKERYVSHWRGSLKWSGFEGGRKHNESIELSAAREFVEECMGVVSIDGSKNVCSIDEVQENIKKKEFFMRTILCINHSEMGYHEKRFHVTYVFEVPEQDDCVERFMKTRKLFLELQYKIIQCKKLFETIESNPNLPCENSIFNNIVISAVISVTVDNHNIRIKVLDDQNNEYLIEQKIEKFTEYDICTYLKWFSCRIEIEEEIKIFSHINKAIDVKKNSNNFFLNATVNEEYTEKQQIYWWSLEDLEMMIRNGGFINNDYFRAYFLPVLHRTIIELSELKKNV